MSEQGSQKPRLSKAVAALAQAALALPGLAPAAQDVQTDYLFSWYREGDLPAAQSNSGREVERYQIQSHFFRVLTPLREHQLGATLVYETMSGASPWYVDGTSGRPLQVMSGASIREERVAADATATLALDTGKLGVTLGASDEDDYQSVSGALSFEHPNADQSVTWSGGLRYSDDRLMPTQGRTPTDVLEADKNTATAYGGVSVVLDRRNVFQAGLSLTHNDGYLTDPYKRVYIQAGQQIVAERRPGERLGWAGTLKLRRHLRGPDAALHLDYRYYHDDWEIDSHTIEAAWHQRIAGEWRVIPALRWYTQSQAFFYGAYFSSVPADGYRSSDYRLSPFGAISARLDAVKTVERWELGAGAEYYEASGAYALGEVAVENPGLVEYLGAHLRVSYRF